jgi:streptomycin 3"-adenylyltransferase
MLERDLSVALADPARHVLVARARSDRRAVGYVDLVDERAEDGRPWLGVVEVDADEQRHGLGRQCVEAVATRARDDLGARSLRAMADADDDRGEAFLRSLGFVPVDERERSSPLGRVGVIVYEASLAPEPVSPELVEHEHERGRAQSWETVDDDLRSFIAGWVDRLCVELSRAGFVGAYLHGSLAMGSFYRPKSDLDVLFVVERALTSEERRAVALRMCELSDERPVVGDPEMSVVRRAETTDFHQPLPLEVQYSAEWKQAIRDGEVDFSTGRSDPELAAYCTAVRARGVCLRGEPITEVFGPVPPQANRDAVLYDLAWILQDDRMLESPIYGVLNCCRVLAFEASGKPGVLSKDEGGVWALANLPDEHRRIVAQALACYRSPEPVSPEDRRTHGHDWDQRALLAFRDYVQGHMRPVDALGLTKGQVHLAEADPRWPGAFEYLAAVLRAALGESAAAIEHVGSTAVAGLPAKPILDVAVRLAPDVQLDHVTGVFQAQGYEFRGDQGKQGGLVFVLEDRPTHRLAHVHCVRHGDSQWQRYLAARDRLRSDPATRDAYAALKRRLADQHPSDRGAYTDGKASFLEGLGVGN